MAQGQSTPGTACRCVGRECAPLTRRQRGRTCCTCWGARAQATFKGVGGRKRATQIHNDRRGNQWQTARHSCTGCSALLCLLLLPHSCYCCCAACQLNARVYECNSQLLEVAPHQHAASLQQKEGLLAETSDVLGTENGPSCRKAHT